MCIKKVIGIGAFKSRQRVNRNENGFGACCSLNLPLNLKISSRSSFKILSWKTLDVHSASLWLKSEQEEVIPLPGAVSADAKRLPVHLKSFFDVKLFCQHAKLACKLFWFLRRVGDQCI